MTERRLTTEDFAAPRGAADQDGAIVPQRDQRDEQVVDRHDTVDDTSAGHHDTGVHGDSGYHEDSGYHGSGGHHDTDVHDSGFHDSGHQDSGHEPGAHHGDHDHRPQGHDRDDPAPDQRDDVGPGAVGHGQYGEHPVDREPVEPSATSTTAGDAPLFGTEDSANYQAEWRALQADFVDDPREAVQRADELVAQVIQNLATTFAEHKRSLEGQWQEGAQVDTEELRQALKRYRSFFDRLLSV
ncbi:hypothetical protein Q5530_13735 [Saccharothrix sp. BKS2]|uniref:hypothetical protein n=1 Tax=Saccharothrix sp. BKS2 TaxID=3064400 RepID=UPI0039EC4963